MESGSFTYSVLREDAPSCCERARRWWSLHVSRRLCLLVAAAFSVVVCGVLATVWTLVHYGDPRNTDTTSHAVLNYLGPSLALSGLVSLLLIFLTTVVRNRRKAKEKKMNIFYTGMKVNQPVVVVEEPRIVDSEVQDTVV